MRDCTQPGFCLQVPPPGHGQRALTHRDLRPSMPRNLTGAADATPNLLRAVADDFSAVDEIIKKQLTSRVPLVSKIGDYITSAGGQR